MLVHTIHQFILECLVVRKFSGGFQHLVLPWNIWLVWYCLWFWLFQTEFWIARYNRQQFHFLDKVIRELLKRLLLYLWLWTLCVHFQGIHYMTQKLVDLKWLHFEWKLLSKLLPFPLSCMREWRWSFYHLGCEFPYLMPNINCNLGGTMMCWQWSSSCNWIQFPKTLQWSATQVRGGLLIR